VWVPWWMMAIGSAIALPFVICWVVLSSLAKFIHWTFTPNDQQRKAYQAIGRKVAAHRHVQHQLPASGWRFNPAPGWPQPPAGWQWTPGWRPDPAWSQPPAGWQFWVPAQPAADTTTVDLSRHFPAAGRW